MSNKPAGTLGAATEEAIHLTRLFDAPRERVWAAWTDPEQLMRWWGPAGFSSPVARIDFREGGRYLYCMQDPGGKEYWSTGTYREIVPMERIVCTDSFADSEGNPVSAAHYGMGEEWPLELMVTLTFAEDTGKTRFTLHHVGVPGAEMREMCAQGWNESFDKLAESLVA